MVARNGGSSIHNLSDFPTNGLTRNTHPLQSLDMCSVPVEILATPTFHYTQGPGKCSQERFEFDDENGPSEVTATDPCAYAFYAAKVRSLISSRESLIYQALPPS